MKKEQDPNSMQALKMKMRAKGMSNKDIKKMKVEFRKITQDLINSAKTEGENF